MYKYSKKSSRLLRSCHVDLQYIFNEALKKIDHSILCGQRGKEDQEKAFNENKSGLHYPFSKHNKSPSTAIDVAPYPIDWEDTKRFTLLAGIVIGIASQLKQNKLITHDIRWGGDWDGDNDLNDQKFNDLGHFELV